MRQSVEVSLLQVDQHVHVERRPGDAKSRSSEGTHEHVWCTDFFQRTITDVGAIGPDRGRGGLYLLLPPDYQGHVPDAYFSFKSSTYNVFLFFRTVMVPGKNGPDTGPAVETAERTRIYPLWELEKDIPAMKFPNAAGQRVNMMYPTDFTYWEKLKDRLAEVTLKRLQSCYIMPG